jgi:hypothetical protein
MNILRIFNNSTVADGYARLAVTRDFVFELVQ